VGNLTHEPSAINGRVNVVKYRVIIEVVEEPKSVIAERLQKLLDECDNHHLWGPIRAAAAQHGVTIKKKELGLLQ